MSTDGIPETEVPFYLGEDLICKIIMTSRPALDISFTHEGKRYKVIQVSETKNGFKCQVNLVNEEGRVIKGVKTD